MAELVQVSPQAVSKWENGRALPDTALLPVLAKTLHTSIDDLLNQNDFQILSACPIAKERPTFLIVKYQMGDNISYIFAKEKDRLLIDAGTSGIAPLAKEEKLRIIAAVYGTRYNYNNAMTKIEHYKFFNWNGYLADQETFPSNPAIDGKEYLTLVYLNQDGIHFATCEEGEYLQYTSDGCNLFQKKANGEYYIPNVPKLPAFGKGNDCSWAAAFTGALQAMGVSTDYTQVMDVSGACL